MVATCVSDLNGFSGSILSCFLGCRRGSNHDQTNYPPTEGSDLHFSQRLLLANENAVTKIPLDISVPLTRIETMTSDNDALLSSPPSEYRTWRFPPHIGGLYPRTINLLHPSILVSSVLPYHTAHLCLSWFLLVE